MDTPSDIRELQSAASYLMLEKRLKFTGFGSMLFGMLAIMFGMDIPSWPGVALAMVGAFLVVEGFWVITSPSPAGLLVGGIGVITVGLCTFAAVLALNVPPFWIILGILQLKWGYDRYREYRMATDLTNEESAEETVKFMRALVKDILARDPNSSDDLIILVLKSVQCKVLLMERIAVFITAGGRGVMVRHKDEVDLVKQKDGDRGRFIQVSGEITDNMPALITPEHFARYRSWAKA